jgi:hypothetical protein
MRTWLPVLIAVLVALPAQRARANDDITVRAAIDPPTAQVGQQVTLTVEVKGKFRKSAQPELPPLDDFDVFQAGTSQNFSFVNGQASASILYSYVLVPEREGTYTIAPITLTMGGKQYTADPVSIEVVSGNAAVPAPGASPPAGAGNRELPLQDESIFVASSVDRDTVYVNQQVTWTLGYYTDGRVELLRSPNYSPPTAEGFWVEDLPPQNKYYANLHGRQYLVSEIKRGFFPTAPGVYTIGEARVDIVVDDVSRRGGVNDFFSRSMRGGFGQPRSLTTEAIEVVVLPLPGRGKPAGFDGAVVSALDVSIAADKQVAQVGEPINVTLEMNGVGNMRTLVPPKIKGIPDFKVYESGSSTDTFKKDYTVSGRRKFDFVLVPQAEGKYTIPPVRVPYFDPVSGAFTVAQSVAVPVEVKPGAAEDGPRVVYAGGGDDFKVLHQDIRFIHAVPASLTSAPPLYARGWFLAVHAVPMLAIGATLLIERRRRRFRSDAGFARASRALREAQQRLRDADGAFRGGDANAGFAHLHAAIYGYFADRMNVPVAGVTSVDIAAFMETHGVDEALSASVIGAIRACEAARYAAGAADANEGQALASSTRETLSRLERALR